MGRAGGCGWVSTSGHVKSREILIAPGGCAGRVIVATGGRI